MVILAACLIVGLLTLTVGVSLGGNLVGGIGGAFENSLNRLTSHVPGTPPPSGTALDTPVIDTPIDGGYTTQPSLPLQGTVPGDVVGKVGYKVNIYLITSKGAQRKLTSVAVGGTTRFITSPVTLTEGSNSFVATLASSSAEGAPSPIATYILDTTAPKLKIASPAHGAKVGTSTIEVSGSCDVGANVAVRNEQAPGGSLNSVTVGADGGFTLTVQIVAGPNTIDLTATDQAGNTSVASVTVTRSYGQLAAHLSVSPTKFRASSKPTLKLSTHASSFGGAPLANASVTFTVTIQGLGPIVSPQLTTNASGVATWQVPITGASAGTGQASVLVTSAGGDVITATAAITTY